MLMAVLGLPPTSEGGAEDLQFFHKLHIALGFYTAL